MANYIKRKELETYEFFRREFSLVDGPDNSPVLSFPCDADGLFIDQLTDEAFNNFSYAIAHPEKYRDLGVNRYERTYITNDVIECNVCASEVELYDQYCAACQCPCCGTWYNLFGQELEPVENWIDDIEF